MKKVILTALLAAVSTAAFAGVCEDYYSKMAADMKKDGAYSEQAMKIIKDQVAAVSADQQEAFCKAALESFNAADKDAGSDKDDAEDKEDEAKG